MIKTIKKTNKSKLSKLSKLSKKSEKYNLPLPDEFRLTRFMEELLYDKNNKKYRNSEDVSDKEIMDYMNNLTNSEKKYLINDIKEIKKYKKLKNKLIFKPITVELLKKKYWNSKTKKFKPVKYYYSNGDDPTNENYGPQMVKNIKDKNKRSKVFCNQFTPNGDLIEYDKITGLKNNKLKLSDHKNYNHKKNFYYLDGKMKYCGSDEEFDNEGLQICNGNYLSPNCVNSPAWI